MAKVIKLHPRNLSYDKYSQSIIRQLDRFDDKLMTAMINLATAGPWRHWNDTLEEGATFEFNPGMFDELTDPGIVAIRELRERLLVTKQILNNSQR